MQLPPMINVRHANGDRWHYWLTACAPMGPGEYALTYEPVEKLGTLRIRHPRSAARQAHHRALKRGRR